METGRCRPKSKEVKERVHAITHITLGNTLGVYFFKDKFDFRIFIYNSQFKDYASIILHLKPQGVPHKRSDL